MTNFSDQLFTDLMREHAATLQRTELPAPARHSNVKRGAWLAGGAGTLAVGVTASLAAFGGGAAPAYAVTPHPDGTVTVSISDLSGISGANAKLRDLGDQAVVVVPVRAGCPSIWSLPRPVRSPDLPKGYVFFPNITAGTKGSGTVTIDPSNIPDGDLVVLIATRVTKADAMAMAKATGMSVAQASKAIVMSSALTAPPAPTCVSLQELPGRPPSPLPVIMVGPGLAGPAAKPATAANPAPTTGPTATTPSTNGG